MANLALHGGTPVRQTRLHDCGGKGLQFELDGHGVLFIVDIQDPLLDQFEANLLLTHELLNLV